MQKAFSFTRKGHIEFYLKAGNDTFIEVFHDSEVVRGGPGQALNHFCLETDSIDALWSRLAEHGYAPGQIIMGADNALQFWVKDPSGVDVELQQYTDRSSQTMRGDVEVP